MRSTKAKLTRWNSKFLAVGMRVAIIKVMPFYLRQLLRSNSHSTRQSVLCTGIASSLFALLLSSNIAIADPLNDHLGPKSLAMGESGRGDATGASSTVLNPAGLALDAKLVFSGSYGYRDSDGASIGAVSACDSTTPVAGCFYYKYLKGDSGITGLDTKHRLHEFGTSFSRVLSTQLVLGFTGRYFDYNSTLAGEKDQSGYSADAGLVFLATPSFRIAAVGHNLFGSDAVAYPRGVASGITYKSEGALSINIDALWNLDLEDDQTPGRYGGGVEYFIPAAQPGNGYPIRGGGVYDSTTDRGYVTFGVGFTGVKISLDVGGRKQVSGEGDEIIIQAGLSLVGATPSQQ